LCLCFRLDLNLNENTGTTAYDVSGNGNNGTITGATWADDAVDLTLTDGVDYTLIGKLFTIVNSEYAWSQILTTYEQEYAGSGKDSINKTVVGLAGFSNFWDIIILAVIISIVIGLILVGFGGRAQR